MSEYEATVARLFDDWLLTPEAQSTEKGIIVGSLQRFNEHLAFANNYGDTPRALLAQMKLEYAGERLGRLFPEPEPESETEGEPETPEGGTPELDEPEEESEESEGEPEPVVDDEEE